MRRNKHLLLLLVAVSVIAGGVILSKASAQGISLNELLFPPSLIDLPKTSIQLTNPLLKQKETQRLLGEVIVLLKENNRLLTRLNVDRPPSEKQ